MISTHPFLSHCLFICRLFLFVFAHVRCLLLLTLRLFFQRGRCPSPSDFTPFSPLAQFRTEEEVAAIAAKAAMPKRPRGRPRKVRPEDGLPHSQVACNVEEMAPAVTSVAPTAAASASGAGQRHMDGMCFPTQQIPFQIMKFRVIQR